MITWSIKIRCNSNIWRARRCIIVSTTYHITPNPTNNHFSSRTWCHSCVITITYSMMWRKKVWMSNTRYRSSWSSYVKNIIERYSFMNYSSVMILIIACTSSTKACYRFSWNITPRSCGSTWICISMIKT